MASASSADIDNFGCSDGATPPVDLGLLALAAGADAGAAFAAAGAGAEATAGVLLSRRDGGALVGGFTGEGGLGG